MSRKVIGYRIKNGFIPFKESAFVLENNDESDQDRINSLERKGTIVFAKLTAKKHLAALNSLRVSVPYGFRPKEEYVTLYADGYVMSGTTAVMLKNVFIYKDGTVKFNLGDLRDYINYVIIKNVYWETED